MKIGIVGLGAIGSLWATKLIQSGHKVVAFTRQTSQTQLSIALDTYPETSLDANSLNQLADCDLVLITVKSTQVKQAISPLFDHLNFNTPLIFLHNGMGALDELDPAWHQLPLLLATTTQAAFKPNQQQVKHTGVGQTLIGPYQANQPLSPQVEAIIQALDGALPKVIWQDNIHNALWNKLAINCVINPMTAIYQCKNGALLEPQYQTQIDKLVTECHAVMQAAGQISSLRAISNTIQQVMHNTRDNYSSMHQDIHHQRPTEIDYITGFLLKQAAHYQISLPEHQRLFERIKLLES